MAAPSVGATITTAVNGVGGSSNNLTGSHTTDASTDLLLVLVHQGYPASARLASVVTFDGNGLTKLGTIVNGNGTRADLWYLKAPDIKAATVSVGTWGGVVRAGWTAVNIIGAHQTTTFGTVATATGSSTAMTVTASSASGELVIANAVGGNSIYTLTEGSGITERSQFGHADTIGGEYATGTKPGEASAVMDWTISSSTAWATLAVGIKPAGTDDHTVVPNDCTHAHAADNVNVFEEGAAPAAPTAATVDSFGSNSILGSFTDNTGGVAQHRAYYKLTADSEWTLSATLDVDDVDHGFYGLTVGTSYDIGFTSFGDGGESPMTSTTQVTAGALVIADALHAHAADNVTLISDTDHVLLIGDTWHRHTTAMPLLSGDAVADIRHIGGSHV